MDPFNNSQQNTKENMNPNKQSMAVCVFLSDNPAWERRVCRLVGGTLSGDLPGVPLLGARANTTDTSQQNIIERGVTRSKEERGGEEDLYNTSPALDMFNTPTIWDVSARTKPAQTRETS